MRRIFGYKDFYLEPQLLEARMSYSENFRELLAEMAPESRVAKSLLGLQGKDVDVNTNYIDLASGDRDDMVAFKPDDKVEKAVMIVDGDEGYAGISQWLSERGESGSLRFPPNRQLGQVRRWLDRRELLDMAGNRLLLSQSINSIINEGHEFFIFEWRIGGSLCYMVYDTRSAIFGEAAIKASEVGVGKLARELLKKAGLEFTDREIESFVLSYRGRSSSKKEKSFELFEVVEGEKIYKYYNENSYDRKTGSLGTSCMRYDDCAEFLELYVKNPGVCKLLIKYSDAGREKICGRALIWTDDKGRRVMDRIYVSSVPKEYLFVEWARKNGIYSRKEQEYVDYPTFVGPDGKDSEMSFRIKLGSRHYKNYPYMDTFKYYTTYQNSASVSNDPDQGYDYVLTQTDGTVSGDYEED